MRKYSLKVMAERKLQGAGRNIRIAFVSPIWKKPTQRADGKLMGTLAAKMGVDLSRLRNDYFVPLMGSPAAQW